MGKVKTSTILCDDLSDLLSETRLHESLEWAVRQIVIHPLKKNDEDPIIIVVFEKELGIEGGQQ